MFSESAQSVAENPQLTLEQKAALAELRGNEVRHVKRWTFWTAGLLAGIPTGAIVSLPGIAAEMPWNKITSESANEMRAEDPSNQFAKDLQTERTARRTSRVLGTGLLTAGPLIAVKTTATIAAAGLTAATISAAAPVVAVLGAAELAWVTAKTVENVYNRRATRAARRVAGR